MRIATPEEIASLELLAVELELATAVSIVGADPPVLRDRGLQAADRGQLVGSGESFMNLTVLAARSGNRAWNRGCLDRCGCEIQSAT